LRRSAKRVEDRAVRRRGPGAASPVATVMGRRAWPGQRSWSQL